MANLKKITEIPVAESTENINLIANSNGAAVQVPANQIGAQADWNETDESSPAFIMNKPTSLGGGAVTYTLTEALFVDANYNEVSWEEFLEKFNSGVVRFKEGSNCGTIVGYTVNGSSKSATVSIDGSTTTYSLYY